MDFAFGNPEDFRVNAMLSVSLDLVKKACMEKAGLEARFCTMEKQDNGSGFPYTYNLKLNGKSYSLRVFSEEVEELSTILSYAVFSESGEMLCMARTEFHSPDNPFAEAPYTHLIPETSPCAVCKKKLSGECAGR
ncbi:hypothetical protein [Oribacterium parvum]|uniref:hypothetical protein n=1 Tax=Oribacterium parvum TaxID=1501329 RepID=UPI0028E5BD4B|nr:hypothetical protein [Oribacterium parvum]